MNVITTLFSLENTLSPLLGVATPFPAGKGAYIPPPEWCRPFVFPKIFRSFDDIKRIVQDVKMFPSER